jgi:uncharacterized membrane protein
MLKAQTYSMAALAVAAMALLAIAPMRVQDAEAAQTPRCYGTWEWRFPDGGLCWNTCCLKWHDPFCCTIVIG